MNELITQLATEWCKSLECNDEYCDCLKALAVCEITKDFVAGASAMLSVLLKWMDEPCDRHGTRHHDGRYATSGHKDCPQCMAELKESVK